MENTPEGIDSRINDAEEQRSELEDRMVEISAMEQNKQKRMKIKNDKRPPGQQQTHQHSHYRGSRRRKERDRT